MVEAFENMRVCERLYCYLLSGSLDNFSPDGDMLLAEECGCEVFLDEEEEKTTDAWIRSCW